MKESQTEPTGLYGRLSRRWNAARPERPLDGDGFGDQLRVAARYPTTVDLGTFLTVSLLMLSSVFLVTIPLALGYLLAVTAAASAGSPAPDLSRWRQQIRRGVVAVGLFFSAVVLWFFAVILALVVSFGEPPSVPLGLLLLFGLFYAAPLFVFGYAAGGKVGNMAFRRTTRWVFSLNGLATIGAVWSFLVAGVVVTYVSLVTFVGWLFVGTYLLMSIMAFVGIRYRNAPVALPRQGWIPRPRPSEWLSGVVEWLSAVPRPDGVVGWSRGRHNDENPSSTPSEPSPEPSGHDPGLHWSGTATTVDGPLGYADGEFVEDGTSHQVRILTLTTAATRDRTREPFESVVRGWQGISQNQSIASVYATEYDERSLVAFDPADGPLPTALPDLSPTAATTVLLDVADALKTGRLYNQTHGNLTPDCVHVRTDDDGQVSATVSHWGIERAIRETLSEEPFVTPYTAPEQLAEEPTDKRVDVYQLGALGCYLLTGRPPVDPGSDESLSTLIERDEVPSLAGDARISSSVAAVVEQALSVDPDDRQESAGAFKQELRVALD